MIFLAGLVVLSFATLLFELVAEGKRDRYYRARLDRHDAEIARINRQIEEYYDINKRRRRR
jgi:hypothetical protein